MVYHPTPFLGGFRFFFFFTIDRVRLLLGCSYRFNHDCYYDVIHYLVYENVGLLFISQH